MLSSSAQSLGILLQYSGCALPAKRTITLSNNSPHSNYLNKSSQPLLGVIGAGNYSSRTLLPAFKNAGASFHTLAASSGFGPVYVGRKFGFLEATTDVDSLLADSSCNTVVIATRHDSHASLIQQALAAGKHVFVEKPLCLTFQELISIKAAYTGDNLLMVGFNRRFAPLLISLKNQLERFSGPKSFVYT